MMTSSARVDLVHDPSRSCSSRLAEPSLLLCGEAQPTASRN
jgi:hypothetical protein